MRSFLYIALLILILTASNFCYTYFGFYSTDISKCGAELVHTFDSGVSKANVIYFGESSNFTYSETDSTKKSISELIADLNPNYKILTISKGAIHTSTYKTFIKKIPANSSIKAIILTVNLRSFGINWIESNLETNLSRANIIYSNHPPILKKFLLSFKAYDNKEPFKRKETIKFHYNHDKFTLRSKSFETVGDWDKFVFDKGIVDQAGNKDLKKTETACHFIKNYAFQLHENNPRIKDLDEIIEMCKIKNIQLIYHLLPENYERATELCGADLEILMSDNVRYLKKRFEKKVLFVDNFKLLNDNCFIDRDWPTEHYVYSGRALIAKKINEKLSLQIH